MPQDLEISSIQLGSDSAEKDINEGLSTYFYENNSYKSVFDGKKTILVGNRGVGKSAIFKFLALKERQAGTVVIELSPEEYSYDVLQRALTKEGAKNWNKQSSFSVSWQYLIYNLVFKAIAERPGLQTGARAKIYGYMRDRIKSADLNPIGLLISYLKRLEEVKIGTYEATVKVKELQTLYDLHEIHDVVPHLMKILDKQKIFIFVDELDKGWDNSEDARFFVAGLFQASQRLNILHRNLKVFVSIRQELFENIPQIYDDAQKIREVIEVIRWDEDDLLKFITLRLREAIPESKSIKSDQSVWNKIFSENLQYRGVKSLNYLIDRTQLRPREFLQLCKACMKECPKEKNHIDYDVVTRAEIEYSEQKIKDLASEYKFQYPNLEDIFECFRGLKYTFERKDLEFQLLKMITGEISVGRAEWIKDYEMGQMISVLWQIGFIKAWVVGGLKSGRKSGSSYLGAYELQHLNLDNTMRFQIHNAFRAYLNLKEK